MTAICIEPVAFRSIDQKAVVRAVIVADSVPATLPETGENVKGMTAEQVFAPFSVLYVAGAAESKVYIANESGTFIAQ